MKSESLWVISTFFNPTHCARRIRLYREFAEHMLQSGVTLFTVEAAFCDAPYEVTQESDTYNLQVRVHDGPWHKERMLNLALERIPQHVYNIAWVDADAFFVSPTWVSDTMAKLREYPVAQLFGQIGYLTPMNEMEVMVRGMAKGYYTGGIKWESPEKILLGAKDHPGMAWAARREVIEANGGFLDFCLSGFADLHMAAAWFGAPRLGCPLTTSVGYDRCLTDWARKAADLVQRRVGYVPGLVLHKWHGDFRIRPYDARWRILTDYAYDPLNDLSSTSEGMLAWADTNSKIAKAYRQLMLA